MHIDTGYFDPVAYPIPPLPVERRLEVCVHTPTPEGYHAFYEWCEQASKTHSQIQCQRCGKWAIWLPKKDALQINRRDAKASKAFCEAYEEWYETEQLARIKLQRSQRAQNH